MSGAAWGKVLLLSFAIFFIVEIEKALLPRYIFPCVAALAPYMPSFSCNCNCCGAAPVVTPSTAAAAKPTSATGKPAGAASSPGHVELTSTGNGTVIMSSEYAQELTLSRDLRTTHTTRHDIVPDDPLVQHAIHFTQGKLPLDQIADVAAALPVAAPHDAAATASPATHARAASASDVAVTVESDRILPVPAAAASAAATSGDASAPSADLPVAVHESA